MTHAQLVENINHTRKAKYTDFWFADNFFLCAPKGITKAEARRRYRITIGKKAPKIDEVHYIEIRD